MVIKMNFGNDTRAEEDELLPEYGYTAAAVTLLSIGFFGFFLNLIVIFLMCKDIKLWTPVNIILFNLVCSDFSVSIFGNPFTLIASIHHKWIFGELMCQIYGFFMSLLGIASITTLTVLAYERYSLVTYPLSSHQLSHCGAYFSILFIWLYSLVLTTPPLFGWGAYVNEAANISCSVNWESQTYNASSYIIFLFLFGLFVPVIVIMYSYINIIKSMKQTSSRLGRVNRGEWRVTVMVAIMILTFLFAWTPYAIFALMEQFGPPDLITPGLAVLPALIAKSSICYNPLIYVGLNTQFRAAWKRVWFSAADETCSNDPMNNNTKSSSKITVECTTFDILKRKPKSIANNPMNSQKTKTKANQKLDSKPKKASTFNTKQKPFKSTRTNQTDDSNNGNIGYELSVINGNAVLIKSNTYTSNLS